MSQAIDCSAVRSVLLVDGWHRVVKETFKLLRYEYGQGEEVTHTAGDNGLCQTAFQFKDEGGYVISGPITSVLASQAM